MNKEENWIKLAVNGNKEAFVSLIKQHEKSLYRVARSIIQNDEDCADAIQETILKSYQNMKTLKELSFFKTWIIRILINECNLILRKRKRNVLPLQEASVMEHFNEEKIDLYNAVQQLEESLRVVVILYYFEDVSVKQLAEILKIAEGTIKSRLYRARTFLANLLDDHEGRWLNNDK